MKNFERFKILTDAYMTCDNIAAIWLGEIPCFQHFVWVRQPADVDCGTIRNVDVEPYEMPKIWNLS